MAIGTPVYIGNALGSGSSLVTTGAVPTGATVFLIAFSGASTARSLTGMNVTGGLTWTVDYTATYTMAFGWGFGIASAPAPSGLASSTSLQLAWSGALTNSSWVAVYCTGIATSSPKDVSDGQGQAQNTYGANWDTTAISTTFSDTLVIGGANIDGLTTNTPTNGATELADFQNAGDQWSFAVEYKILSAVGSASLTGTFGIGTGDAISAFVAYKGDAASAAAVTSLNPFESIPFMSNRRI